MKRSIALLLSKTGGPPFHGSVGYVNDAIPSILRRAGWDVRAFQPPRPTSGQEAMLPLALASRIAELDGKGNPDVALYDATATALRSPGQWAGRNVLLYHGLAFGPGVWMTSPEIALHCTNSPYLADSLRAFFSFPNWRARRCLHAHGLDRVVSLPLPVPCVEHPYGHPGFGHGTDLPDVVLQALRTDTVWAHAIQPGKQDWFATLAVMYWLNAMARDHGHKAIRLFVPESSLTQTVRAALDALLPSGLHWHDYLVPLPNLNQRALFQLMRSCRFGLAYNTFPEPFGFYVLESIHCGCPIYSNGVGNYRHVLPQGHGLTILETLDMAPAVSGERDAAAYRVVAERILTGLDRAEESVAECGRGAALIREQWNMKTFERALLSALDERTGPVPEIPEFERMRIVVGPLVRMLDAESGRCLSDYASVTLAPEAIAQVRQIAGRVCAELDGAEMERIEQHYGLFEQGILSLAPESVRFAPATEILA